MPTGKSFKVDTSGIADLVRDLRRMEPALAKALIAELRSVGLEVAEEARRRAPRRSGRLAKSIRPSVRQGQISIYSNLPQAPIHEFGGTITPRGTPIRIQGSRYMGDAVDEKAEDVEDELGELVDRTALRYAGFR